MSGSELYEISVGIKPMPRPRWQAVVKACAGKIDSVVELMAGRLDESVMAHVCRQGTGLFPAATEITYQCSCPDGGGGGWPCKPVAATLYGVGVRLDEDPEMLFRLRQVAHAELLRRHKSRWGRGGRIMKNRNAQESGGARTTATSSSKRRGTR